MLPAGILLIIGIASLILEFFVPSFGLIGAIGGAGIIGSIILAFRVSSTAGTVFLITSLILVPALMMIFFRLFPKTFFGKKLILGKSFRQEDGFTSSAGKYSELEGKRGEVLTDLRPVGTVLIDQNKYQAVTAGEYIPKGKMITVKKTEGSKIIVTEADI